MSGRKSKKSQKLGSSRRNGNRNRNKDTEEIESSYRFPQPVNEELESEQKDFHTASEKQLDEDVLLHFAQAATVCTNQQTSASEFHPHSKLLYCKDLLEQAEAVNKRKKMGSTRKSNRGFKGGGIPEEDPEVKVEQNEGISEEPGATVNDVLIKEEGSKESYEHQGLSDYSSNQSSKFESSTLHREPPILGRTIHKKKVPGNGTCHDIKLPFQIQPMGLSSCELDQLKGTAMNEESVSHSFNSVATATESKLPLPESDDSFHVYHQMETLPKTTGQESRAGSADQSLNENWNEIHSGSQNLCPTESSSKIPTQQWTVYPNEKETTAIPANPYNYLEEVQVPVDAQIHSAISLDQSTSHFPTDDKHRRDSTMLKEQNNEGLERDARTEEEKAENDKAKLLGFISESLRIPFEKMYEVKSEAMDTNSQADHLPYRDSEELDTQSIEEAYCDLHEGSDQLPDSKINSNSWVCDEEPFPSNKSTVDEDNEKVNGIAENRNQDFPVKIKPSENICGNSTLSIGEQEDSEEYLLASYETDELTMMKIGVPEKTDISTEQQTLLMYEGLVGSAEKALTTDYVIEPARDFGLSFAEQLQQKGACFEEDTEEDMSYRDAEKEETVLQEQILAQVDEVIMDKSEQICQEDGEILTTSLAYKNNVMIQQSLSTLPDIMSNDTVDHIENVSFQKESIEGFEEIKEQYGQLVVDDERIGDSMFSNEPKLPPVSTGIQNDSPTYHNSSQEASMAGEVYDMESNVKVSSNQVHSSSGCGTMEIIPETQDGLDIPVNIGNIHEFASDQKRPLSWDHSTSEGHLEKAINRESVPVQPDNICLLHDYFTSKDFTLTCSEQNINTELSSQTTKLGLTTSIEPLPITEHPDSKEDGVNSKESVEVGNIECYAQNESKTNTKFKVTQGSQGGHLSDKKEEEQKWKNEETTEGFEHGEEEIHSEQITYQAATSGLLAEPQNAVSKVPLGITEPPLGKEILESKEEKIENGMTGTLPVVMASETVQQVDNLIFEEISKEGLEEMTEQHRQSVVDDERTEDSTSSNKPKVPPVSKGNQNDTSTDHNSPQDASMEGEAYDMKSTEKVSTNQDHFSRECATLELISRIQNSVDIPMDTENIHKVASDQLTQLSWDHSTSEDPLKQTTNRESEPVQPENTCSLIHIQEPIATQDNVITSNSGLSTSGQRRKMGSAQRRHRDQFHESDHKEATEELIRIEITGENKDDEDGHVADEDVYLTDGSKIPSTENEVLEEASKETVEETNPVLKDDSTSEDFTLMCSGQNINSGIFSQTTELDLTTNRGPSQVTEHLDSKEDNVNSKENEEVGELYAQNENKKRRKFGSTRGSQVGHRPDKKVKEQKWKDGETREGLEHGEEERHSEEITYQAATSGLLAEPQSTVSELPLGLTNPPFRKEIMESKEEKTEYVMTGTLPVIMASETVQQVDNVIFEEITKHALDKMTEQHRELVVDDERTEDFTSSSELKKPPVSTGIQNEPSKDYNSPQEPSMAGEVYDIDSVEKLRTSQDLSSPSCDPIEIISRIQKSVDIPVDTENIHEVASEQISQLSWDHSTSEESEPVHPDNTCSLVYIQESKATQYNVINNLGLSTSGQRRKMGSTRRRHRDQFHEDDHNESTEELIGKGGKRDEKDNDDTCGANEEMCLTDRAKIPSIENEVIGEESKETMEKTNPVLKDDSTSEDFTLMCSRQNMNSGSFSQTTELGLTTNRKPSPVTEHPDSKEDDVNSKEYTEMGNTEIHAHNQSKKNMKFEIIQRSQGGHTSDKKEEEQKWKDEEITEEHKHVKEERRFDETTYQTPTSDLLTKIQSAVSKFPLGFTDPPFGKDIIESEEEKTEHGMTGTLPVIMANETVQQFDNMILEEISKEGPDEMTEHDQSVVDDEKIEDSTFSHDQKMPPVNKGILNHTSTFHNSLQDASMAGEVYVVESSEKVSPSQVNSSPACATLELISGVQNNVDIPVDTENIYEVASDQQSQLSCDHNASEGSLKPTNRESEPVQPENTCSLLHIQESKVTQGDAITNNSGLSTSGQRRKMGSTRKSHRKQFHGGDNKESTEELIGKGIKREHKDDEDGHEADEDLCFIDRSTLSSTENEVIEKKSKETMKEVNPVVKDDSTSEDFILMCSEQNMNSGFSFQTADLTLTNNIEPSLVSEHSVSKQDGANTKENVEVGNKALDAQNENKKRRKFGSTRGSQQRPDKQLQKGLQHVEERHSEETSYQTPTSDLLTEPESDVSDLPFGITNPPLGKEIMESKVENTDHGMPGTLPVIMANVTVQQVDNVIIEEINKERLEEMTEQHDRSVVDDERTEASTSSNEPKIPPVITGIQNDASRDLNSPQDASMSGEVYDMESTEKVSPSQDHFSPACGTLELFSGIQHSLDIPVSTENIHEVASDQISQLSWDHSTSESHLKQTTKRESEPVQPDNTCSLVHIKESKTTQDNVISNNSRLITSGQRRIMESTRKSHREQFYGGEHTEFTEELFGNKGKRGDKNNGDVYLTDGFKISSTEIAVIEKESKETMEAKSSVLKDDSPPKDFTLNINSGLPCQTNEFSLSSYIEQSPVTEHPDFKEDGVNSKENVNTGKTELLAHNQSKKKRKFGSTRRTNRSDNKGEEQKLKDEETTQHGDDDSVEIFKAATSGLLTDPQSALSEVPHGIIDISLEKEMFESTEKKKEHRGSIKLPVILTDIVNHNDKKAVDITEQYEKSMAEKERGDESTTSNKQKLPLEMAKFQNDPLLCHTSLEKTSLVDKNHDVKGTENVIPSQEHVSSRSYTMEIVPEWQHSLDITMNIENPHEIVSDLSSWDHSICKDQVEQPRNRESEEELLKSSSTLIHLLESKNPQGNVLPENSGKKRKMGSTRRSHREKFHGSEQKGMTEEMKEKENTKEQKIEEIKQIIEEANPEVEKPKLISTVYAKASHQSIESQAEHSDLIVITSDSLNIIAPELEKLEKQKRKMGSTRKKFKERDSKKTPEITGDMDSRAEEDFAIDKETKVDTVLNDTIFECSVTAEKMKQEDEPQIHNTLDQSESSLHSETAEQCKSTLELLPAQSSQTCTDPSSPGRKRKMGSTRKTPRNKLIEETMVESRELEQEMEKLESGKTSELEKETESALLEVTKFTMDFVDISSNVTEVEQSNAMSMKQPLPGGKRKFGSRHKTNDSRNMSVLTPGECEANQQKTENIQVVTDELTVCDPYFISGTDSTPVSNPTYDHDTKKTSPGNQASVSREVDFGDLRKSALYNGSTGRREVIDFERWNEQIPDFGVAVYNVMMVGNSNVGKTSFIRRFQSGHFSKDYSSTIGVDTFVQTITLGNRTVKLHVWDTAGQERYHSITKQVFHKAQGLLLMYDITCSQSFYAVRNWISQIQERAPTDVIIMLLGNKNDCAERQVLLQDGEDLSREYNIHFMECSAATGENVSESMKILAWLLVKQKVRKEEEQTILQPKQPQKSGCC